MILGSGIIRSRGILGGGILRGGIIVPPDAGDPLSGIPTLLDLRTHTGDKVPFGIAADGLANPEWTGVVGSATQATGASQPLTNLAGDGTPYLDFDGTNDWMSIGVFGGQATYSILVQSKTPGEWTQTYMGLVEQVSGTDPDRWGLMEGIGWHLNPYPAAVRYNGVASAGAPFNSAVLGWQTITVKTNAAANAVERGIAQLSTSFFGAIDLIALFIHDGDPTTEQIETVEAYYETLKPA